MTADLSHWIDQLDRQTHVDRDDVFKLTGALRTALNDGNVYVPGVWRCAKCSFEIVASVLNVSTGSMHANRKPQTCPNDGSPMWRVTWKDRAKDAMASFDKTFDEKRAAETRATAAETALASIEALDLTEQQFVMLGPGLGALRHLRKAVAIAKAAREARHG